MSLLLTKEPLFVNKGELIKDSCFVLGYDTFTRLLNPKYYGSGTNDDLCEALEAFAKQGTSFVVGGRLIDGKFIEANNAIVPEAYHGLFDFISETEFRLDLSSTELRAAA